MGINYWINAVRRIVCYQLILAQLPHSELRQRRWRVDGCGVLLHGQCHGSAAWHGLIWMGISGLWLARLLVGVVRILVDNRVYFRSASKA